MPARGVQLRGPTELMPMRKGGEQKIGFAFTCVVIPTKRVNMV